jgi:hypothetical protein
VSRSSLHLRLRHRCTNVHRHHLSWRLLQVRLLLAQTNPEAAAAAALAAWMQQVLQQLLQVQVQVHLLHQLAMHLLL